MSFNWKLPKKKTETRSSFDSLIDARLAAASSTEAVASDTSAITIAAQALSRALSAASITGGEGLTRNVLGQIGSDLIRFGESVWIPGDWLRASGYDLHGNYQPESWEYRLTIPGPTTLATLTAPASSVAHFRWATTPAQPWKGIPPTVTAKTGATLLARLEIALSDEAAAAVGQLLPTCLLYTSPSPRDRQKSRMPSSA